MGRNGSLGFPGRVAEAICHCTEREPGRRVQEAHWEFQRGKERIAILSLFEIHKDFRLPWN